MLASYADGGAALSGSCRVRPTRYVIGPAEPFEQLEEHRAKHPIITLRDDAGGGIAAGAERRQPHREIRPGDRGDGPHPGAADVAPHRAIHGRRWGRGGGRGPRKTPP